MPWQRRRTPNWPRQETVSYTHLDVYKRQGEHVVLVDAGPQQHGVPRLVQLAILIVVKRRSSAAGSGLRVGILGDPADRWLVGVLGHVLTTWRQRRQPTGPTVGDIEARLVALTAEGSTSTTADHLWLVAGPTLAAQPHEVRHLSLIHI